eukprot:TRINITY_DN50980_c0_g1_i1.p1 TRINITY_DN50980_c0_g1~~TRINITY_DN50980_c0_g1_i1.p1  ORF type:complete len:152 (+),score=21.00 TRINITY_DN50980_c0_g1_i1:93-548(+)
MCIRDRIKIRLLILLNNIFNALRYLILFYKNKQMKNQNYYYYYSQEMITEEITNIKIVKQNLTQVHASFDQLCDQVNDKLQQIKKDFNIKYENLKHEFSMGSLFLIHETDEKSKDIRGDREDMFIIDTELNNMHERILVQERNLGFKAVDL